MFRYETLQEALKDLVPKKGKSNAEVARPLGISGQILGAYIAGKRSPKVGFYKKWHEVYGENLFYLTETNVSRETKPVPQRAPSELPEDYLDLLRYQITKQKEEIAQLKSTILSLKDEMVNLKFAQQNPKTAPQAPVKRNGSDGNK